MIMNQYSMKSIAFDKNKYSIITVGIRTQNAFQLDF
jgi:hypothetical protein